MEQGVTSTPTESPRPTLSDRRLQLQCLDEPLSHTPQLREAGLYVVGTGFEVAHARATCDLRRHGGDRL
jgi:hypothetical protein